MPRLFDFEDFPRWMRDAFGPESGMIGRDFDFLPEANVTESEKAIEVAIELPGMKPEDVKVELHDRVLTISGEKKEEKEETGKTRQDVADGILRPVGRPCPHGDRAQRAQLVVAKAIGDRLEEGYPPRVPLLACRREQQICVAGGDQRKVVDRRQLVAGRARRWARLWLRHPPVAFRGRRPQAAAGAAAGDACAPSR